MGFSNLNINYKNLNNDKFTNLVEKENGLINSINKIVYQ